MMEMKLRLSILFLILTFSAEVIAYHGCYTCERVTSEINTESAEECEVQPVVKNNSGIKKSRPANKVITIKKHFIKRENLASHRYQQHSLIKVSTPIYLSNSVFLI